MIQMSVSSIGSNKDFTAFVKLIISLNKVYESIYELDDINVLTQIGVHMGYVPIPMKPYIYHNFYVGYIIWHSHTNTQLTSSVWLIGHAK